MKGKILLLLTLLFINYADSQNLLTNGGFENGGSGFGFVTNGAGYTPLATPYSGTTNPGNFAVVTNPNLLNTADFIYEGDHTTGSGRMLVIDGNTDTTSPRFWRAGNTGNGITTLTIGTTYRFSYWIKSVSNLGSPAEIALQVTGGTTPVLLSGSTTAPAPSQSWRHVVYSFTATATTARIELYNTNTSAAGNDFAVDDFMLTANIIVSPNVTDATCTTAADGSITLTAFGGIPFPGTPPYYNYSITGPVTQNNTTGVFTNLPPGNYQVTASDNTLPTAMAATLSNIIVGPRITVPANGAVCAGNSFQLNAVGSSTGYSWTSSPAGFTSNIANPVVTPAVTTTYTVTSTIGACAPISSSVTVTVNPLPSVTSPSDSRTICPGNTATFTITGTANSTVTLTQTNPAVGPLTVPVNIGPTGTGTFTTPILNVSATWTVTIIKNFFTLCERNYTVPGPPTITLAVTVVPNGCATVRTDPATGTPPLDLTLCTTGECRTLQANFSDVPATTTYGVSSIPYCPYPFVDPDPTTAPVYNVVNITSGDDFWSDVIPLPFNFCFYGQNYNQCNAGTNGLLTFIPRTPGSFCDWPDTSVPVANQNQNQSIFGVYQDTDFGIPPSASDRQVNWVLEGQYPCRKLIVNFYNMGQWNATNNPGLQTSQIVLYEVSNIVEVFVQRRVAGNPWAGSGAIGLKGGAGQWITAPGRDTGNWSVLTGEAWRFTPTGPNVPVTIDWFEGPVSAGNHIGSGPTQVVCPATTTTYTLQATYQVCGVPQTATSPVTLNVKADLTGEPDDLTECTNIFDLTENTPVILGSLNPLEYDITYHTTAGTAGAATGSNPIALPTAYSPGTTGTHTVYASIFLNSFNCRVVKAFDLIIDNCVLTPDPVTDVTICDDPSNDGVAQFDFTPQLLEGLGSNNPADYTMTLHSSQPDADNGTPFISPVNNVTANNGQIFYIRITDNSDPTIFGTGSFTVHINPLPTASIAGTTTICSGTNTTITFTGTPNTTVNFTVDGNADSVTLNNLGTATVTTPNLTVDSSYVLVSVVNPVTTCTRTLTGSALVTVKPLPTATISGTTAVCQGTPSPLITFTGANGTAPYTFTYTNPAGATASISTTGANTTVTLPVSTANAGTFTYTLVSVADSAAPSLSCSQNQTGTATVTVNPMPTATISGTTSVCQNDPSPVITFTGSNGNIPYTFTYTDATGTHTVLSTGTGNTATVSVPTTTAGTFTYTLVSVAGDGSPACSQPQTGSAIVTVRPLPTATISGTTTVCQGSPNPVITFTGANATAPYTFTYSTDAGATTQTITTTTGNSVTLPVSTATAGTFTYTLISVQGSGTPACSQPQTGSATVTVSPMPTATISGTVSVCQNDPSPLITFTGSNGNLPYTFTYTDATGTHTVPSVGSTSSATVAVPTTTAGTFTYTLVSVAGAGSPACSQPQSGSATVTVGVAPTINTPTNYVVCDDSLNNDGIYCNFILSSKNPEITTATNVVITYHETLTDAQTGGTPITAVPYCNIRAFDQEIFVRVYTIGAPLCYSTTSFHLIINPIPLPNPVITPYQLCDYNAPGDGIEVFNLSTKTTEIANSQPNVVIRYYDTLANAQNNTGVGELPNLYPSASAQIWFNIRNTVTGCNTTGSFNLVVNPLPLAVTPPPIFECSNGSSLTATFNLTVNEGVSTGGQTGRLVTYHNFLLDAQNGTPFITTPTIYPGTDGEIIYVRIQDTATGCYSTTTQLLRVTQGPLAVTPTPLEICDPNRDGFGPFDLDSKILEIMGGVPDPNVTVTFHETSDDALLGSNSKSSPYTNITPYLQPIYVRVFYTTTGCANYVTLNLIVHDNPLATTPTPYPLCDNTGLANEETFDLTTKIPEILGSLSPANYTVTFYTDRGDAEFPRNRITSIAAYTSPTDTLYVRVEDNTTHCFDIVELELIVNPLPNSLQPNYPQYSLCDNTQSPASEIGYELFDLDGKVSDVLLGQTGMIVTFYPSLSAAQNNLSPITVSPYRNIIQYVQTLGIRITNSQTGCYVISTMDIRVEPLPTLIPPSRPYTLCDDDQDGYTTFDLTTLLSGMLNGITTYTVSFHETYDDALLNGTTIPNPAAYDNVNPYTQTIFVRAEDNLTHCVSIISIQLVVNPGPVAPINLADIVVCDTDTNSQDGITRVDLTQRNADALAVQQGAASDYIVEYYLSQTAADIGTSPIIPATSYPATNGQTIWVRVEHITTGCYNTGTFDIVINSPLLLITPTPLSLCDDDANPNNQFHSFDLTVKNNEITQNLPYTVTYYPTYAMAQAQVAGTEIATPTAYTNVSPAVQTLGVVVTTGAGCKSITTLDIRVLPIPTPRTNPPALAPKCDDNNPGDMVEVFDLTVNEAYIRNNDPSLSFSYYYNQADALVPRNPIPVPTAATVGGNVWIRVENTRVDYLGNHCFVLVEQALTVNPLPAVNPSPAPYRVCDDNADGIADFDMTLPALATSILNTATTGQQPADFTISYYLTAAGANPATNTGETPLPNTYTNTASPNSQVVYIRVVNNATGCVNPAGTLTLAVEAYATATGPQTFADCDNYNDPYDGVHRIDLTQYETAILNGQNPAVFLVSYYTSLTDAQAGTGALTLAEAQAYETDPDTDTIWVKVENSSNLITPYCYAITTIDITVERYPNPIINTPNGVTTICVDFVTGAVVRPLTLDSGITNPANYTFEWFENGSTTPIAGATGSTYTVSTADAAGATRSYTVHVTSTSALGCDTTSASFDVIQSGQASIPTGTVGYTVTNAFTASQIITVTVEGYGTYEYSLDDGPRQTSNVFENVSLGSHVIHVWDTEGGIAYSCEELIINDVMVIDYPHYFTPNGDGIHDTWNIVGLANQPAAKIYIFDRYGKLLKQISSAGAGWDGTYNGHLLPADDYWFTVDFMEQSVMKQFKAHFTLKR